ncbi:MAG: hypothetical protein K2N94_00340 [Lachnospiraceae bacterium]|nr:hypothetical protein [Lachnospiraceae bacterium]
MRADNTGKESTAAASLRAGSTGTGVLPELDGVRARRLRAQLAELRREADQEKEMPKDRRQEAEEEFDAWRKRNGGEQERHGEDGRG